MQKNDGEAQSDRGCLGGGVDAIGSYWSNIFSVFNVAACAGQAFFSAVCLWHCTGSGAHRRFPPLSYANTAGGGYFAADILSGILGADAESVVYAGAGRCGSPALAQGGLAESVCHCPACSSMVVSGIIWLVWRCNNLCLWVLLCTTDIGVLRTGSVAMRVCLNMESFPAGVFAAGVPAGGAGVETKHYAATIFFVCVLSPASAGADWSKRAAAVAGLQEWYYKIKKQLTKVFIEKAGLPACTLLKIYAVPLGASG